MYKWEKPKDIYKHVHHHQDYDPKYPTFSSSLLDQINKSLKTHQEEELSFFREPQGQNITNQEKKMSSLRRACLVEKWMEKKVNEKIISRNSKPQTTPTTRTTLLDEFDIQDTLFFSSTTTTKTEYSVFLQKSSGRGRAQAHPPPRPERVATRPAIESTYLQKARVQSSNKSRANKIYSNLLKQPISPGARLSGFISSLFKEGKTGSRSKKKECTSSRSEQASTCSSASSFSRSCLSKNSSPKNSNGGNCNNKRTVRFCLDEDSRHCGEKSKFSRSISKRYQELRKLNGLERENNQKDLEEIALDLLSGYWDSKLNSSTSNSKVANHSDTHVKEKMINDGDYAANHGGNYDGDDGDYDDDDDGLSCSSSDLFELDHLSLIGNELPVYETTQFDSSYL